MRESLKSFLKCRRGNFATTIGVAAVPLMLVAGGAVDYTMMQHAQGALQEVADGAALVGVKELAIAGTSKKTAESVAKNYANSSIFTKLSLADGDGSVTVGASASDNRELTVSMAYYWEPLLLHFIKPDALPLKVNATAKLTGKESICVVALDPSSSGALSLSGKSSMEADGCSVYSNSKSSEGISLVQGATLSAVSSYSSGGYDGPLEAFDPRPITDSPQLTDPLASRKQPAAGSCKEYDLKLSAGVVTLSPGTYCGGIDIGGLAQVVLLPGNYTIKDGPLIVEGNASMIGEFVGISFVGEASTFSFGTSTQVHLTAPKTGPLAGILFFEDRSSSKNRMFEIKSKDAERFEGTIYLPNAKLFIDKESRLGLTSNWTAIIANQIEIGQGPNVQINSDYAKSEIPVPNGIGPSASAHLKR